MSNKGGAQFGETLKKLRFDDEIMDFVCQALKESHTDKRQYHEESLIRLQAEYKKLETRIDGMYTDNFGRQSQANILRSESKCMA